MAFFFNTAMNRKIAVIVLTVISLMTSSVFAQRRDEQNNPKIRSTDSRSKKKTDEEKEPIVRWHYGFNFGTYFANKYTANYYNGSEGNVNKFSYVYDNRSWYYEIKQIYHLGETDSLYLRELPTNMHYKTPITGGLFLRYSLTHRLDFFLDANFVKLKTDDAITMYTSKDTTSLQLPSDFPVPIHGEEERINFDLGVHYIFPVYKNKMNLFIEGGMNLNYIKVLKSIVYFDPKEYSLINIYGNQQYSTGYNTQEFPVTQGGIGYGVFGGGGIGFTFVPQLGLELGGNVRYVNVNLEGYTAFKPSLEIYLRFVFGSFKSQDDD
jgi:hypothetical protein